MRSSGCLKIKCVRRATGTSDKYNKRSSLCMGLSRMKHVICDETRENHVQKTVLHLWWSRLYTCNTVKARHKRTPQTPAPRPREYCVMIVWAEKEQGLPTTPQQICLNGLWKKSDNSYLTWLGCKTDEERRLLQTYKWWLFCLGRKITLIPLRVNVTSHERRRMWFLLSCCTDSINNTTCKNIQWTQIFSVELTRHFPRFALRLSPDDP